MSDVLSQEEINMLLGGGGAADEGASEKLKLTDEERDALLEIGNTSMGAASSTLFTLVNQRVTILAPEVTEMPVPDLKERISEPSVFVSVDYTKGIEGSNFLILDEAGAKVIAELMMGGDASELPETLDELHLSAISEAANQMIASSSIALSDLFGIAIDISPPDVAYEKIDVLADKEALFNDEGDVVVIAFNMKIGDLVTSEIVQIMTVEVAKGLAKNMLDDEKRGVVMEKSQEEAAPAAQPAQQPVQQPAPSAPSAVQSGPAVNAQTVQFESLNLSGNRGASSGEIDLIRNVPLEISVELGRTTKKISEILSFGTGTVIELNRLVGEPLDVLVNGSLIGRGEVVVVDEHYGVRITEIVVPNKQ
ncbi:MAG: flagellar motor switch phosphatase FliY [Clostridiales bacterium]|nr:MAG: flagellar motor switch phosphatase FliY [Clostridiales bacterium]